MGRFERKQQDGHSGIFDSLVDVCNVSQYWQFLGFIWPGDIYQGFLGALEDSYGIGGF